MKSSLIEAILIASIVIVVPVVIVIVLLLLVLLSVSIQHFLVLNQVSEDILSIHHNRRRCSALHKMIFVIAWVRIWHGERRLNIKFFHILLNVLAWAILLWMLNVVILRGIATSCLEKVSTWFCLNIGCCIIGKDSIIILVSIVVKVFCSHSITIIIAIILDTVTESMNIGRLDSILRGKGLIIIESIDVRVVIIYNLIKHTLEILLQFEKDLGGYETVRTCLMSSSNTLDV